MTMKNTHYTSAGYSRSPGFKPPPPSFNTTASTCTTSGGTITGASCRNTRFAPIVTTHDSGRERDSKVKRTKKEKKKESSKLLWSCVVMMFARIDHDATFSTRRETIWYIPFPTNSRNRGKHAQTMDYGQEEETYPLAANHEGFLHWCH